MKPHCMRVLIVGFILVGVLCVGRWALADMSSSNFEIRWDTVSQGGSDARTSASYLLRDTAGNAGAGNSSSASYDLRAGYRQGIYDQVIAFEVQGQNNGSRVDATALVGNTITVSSTAGYSVDDLIVLVQDEGDGQVSAIGRIVSVGGGSITVDDLKDGGTAPVIDGSSDAVYRLEVSSATLGSLTVASVHTAVIGFEVNADLSGGYVVQTFDDGNLRSGANDIDDVADGSVTPGSEEYGGRSSDTSLSGSTFDTQDTAFTTSPEDVADESATSFESRNFVTLKAAISSGTPSGSYGQVLSFIVSGNY